MDEQIIQTPGRCSLFRPKVLTVRSRGVEGALRRHPRKAMAHTPLLLAPAAWQAGRAGNDEGRVDRFGVWLVWSAMSGGRARRLAGPPAMNGQPFGLKMAPGCGRGISSGWNAQSAASTPHKPLVPLDAVLAEEHSRLTSAPVPPRCPRSTPRPRRAGPWLRHRQPTRWASGVCLRGCRARAASAGRP